MNVVGVPEVEGFEAAEGEGAGRVSGVEVLVAAALEQEADAHLLLGPTLKSRFSASSKRARRAAARHAGAALLKASITMIAGVREDAWPCPLGVDLQPDLVKHVLADDPLGLDAHLVVAARGVVCALGKVEAADAGVLGRILAVPELETERLVVGQRCSTRRDVRRLGRTAHVVAEPVPVVIDRDDGVGLVVALAVELKRIEVFLLTIGPRAPRLKLRFSSGVFAWLQTRCARSSRRRDS